MESKASIDRVRHGVSGYRRKEGVFAGDDPRQWGQVYGLAGYDDAQAVHADHSDFSQ